MYTDIKVRQLGPDEWDLFRKIRIASIEESPTAFKYTPEQANELPDSYWKEALANDSWFIGTHGGHIVAIGGLMPLKDNPSQKEIASVWIDPEARGSGAFKKFVTQVIGQAREQGIDTLYASIFEDNAISTAAFNKFGFYQLKNQPSKYQPDRNIIRLATCTDPIVQFMA